MAKQQVRKRVGIVTTGMALSALLAGPAMTLGLGVPTTGATTQVTSNVQGTVDTTQQTAATTVTQVETTVQTTTQQAVAQAPVQAPAATPVSPAPQPSSPQAPATAVRTQPTRTAAPKTSTRRAAASVPSVTRSVGTALGAVTRRATATSPARTVTQAKRAAVVRRLATPLLSTTSSPATSQALAPCPDLSALQALPGGSSLQALLSLACDTATNLVIPARIGTAHAGSSPTGLSQVLGAIAASVGSAHGRLADLASHTPGQLIGSHRVGSRAPAATASANSGSGTLVSRAYGRATGPGAGASAASGHPGSTATGGTSAPAAQPHSWLSNHSPGTSALMLVLIVDLALLAGIVLWRLAQRWVVPRFA